MTLWDFLERHWILRLLAAASSAWFVLLVSALLLGGVTVTFNRKERP